MTANPRYPSIQGAALVWLGMSLLEGTILAAQESIPVGFAIPSAAIHYGWLWVLAIPVWRVCWRLGETPPSRLWLVLIVCKGDSASKKTWFRNARAV